MCPNEQHWPKRRLHPSIVAIRVLLHGKRAILKQHLENGRRSLTPFALPYLFVFILLLVPQLVPPLVLRMVRELERRDNVAT